MNKYDKDMEAVDLKIQIMKNNHIAALEQREELEKTVTWLAYTLYLYTVLFWRGFLIFMVKLYMCI
jgi:hypothetical protein